MQAAPSDFGVHPHVYDWVDAWVELNQDVADWEDVGIDPLVPVQVEHPEEVEGKPAGAVENHHHHKHFDHLKDYLISCVISYFLQYFVEFYLSTGTIDLQKWKTRKKASFLHGSGCVSLFSDF